MGQTVIKKKKDCSEINGSTKETLRNSFLKARFLYQLFINVHELSEQWDETDKK